MQKMTTNDAIIRHNFISKVVFKDGDSVLSKNLKVKIMSMRIEYGKIHKTFDSDVQEFTQGILEDDFRAIQQIPENERTEEQKVQFNEYVNKYNLETNEYINKRALDEVEVKEFTLDMDEYSELLETNSGNDVTINDTEILAADFLEVLYELFVTDENDDEVKE